MRSEARQNAVIKKNMSDRERKIKIERGKSILESYRRSRASSSSGSLSFQALPKKKLFLPSPFAVTRWFNVAARQISEMQTLQRTPEPPALIQIGAVRAATNSDSPILVFLDNESPPMHVSEMAMPDEQQLIIDSLRGMVSNLCARIAADQATLDQEASRSAELAVERDALLAERRTPTHIVAVGQKLIQNSQTHRTMMSQHSTRRRSGKDLDPAQSVALQDLSAALDSLFSHVAGHETALNRLALATTAVGHSPHKVGAKFPDQDSGLVIGPRTGSGGIEGTGSDITAVVVPAVSTSHKSPTTARSSESCHGVDSEPQTNLKTVERAKAAAKREVDAASSGALSPRAPASDSTELAGARHEIADLPVLAALSALRPGAAAETRTAATNARRDEEPRMDICPEQSTKRVGNQTDFAADAAAVTVTSKGSKARLMKSESSSSLSGIIAAATALTAAQAFEEADLEIEGLRAMVAGLKAHIASKEQQGEQGAAVVSARGAAEALERDRAVSRQKTLAPGISVALSEILVVISMAAEESGVLCCGLEEMYVSKAARVDGIVRQLGELMVDTEGCLFELGELQRDVFIALEMFANEQQYLHASVSKELSARCPLPHHRLQFKKPSREDVLAAQLEEACSAKDCLEAAVTRLRLAAVADRRVAEGLRVKTMAAGAAWRRAEDDVLTARAEAARLRTDLDVVLRSTVSCEKNKQIRCGNVVCSLSSRMDNESDEAINANSSSQISVLATEAQYNSLLQKIKSNTVRCAGSQISSFVADDENHHEIVNDFKSSRLIAYCRGRGPSGWPDEKSSIVGNCVGEASIRSTCGAAGPRMHSPEDEGVKVAEGPTEEDLERLQMELNLGASLRRELEAKQKQACTSMFIVIHLLFFPSNCNSMIKASFDI
jgi:hypothetical protein